MKIGFGKDGEILLLAASAVPTFAPVTVNCNILCWNIFGIVIIFIIVIVIVIIIKKITPRLGRTRGVGRRAEIAEPAMAGMK